MSVVHRIRLNGPWTVERKRLSAEVVDPPRSIRFPARWVEIDALPGENVICSRRFHSPTGLDEQTRLWIVVEFPTAVPDIRQVSWFLNDGPCVADRDGSERLRMEVTGRITAQNLLRCVISRNGDGVVESQPEGLVTVCLEIQG